MESRVPESEHAAGRCSGSSTRWAGTGWRCPRHPALGLGVVMAATVVRASGGPSPPRSACRKGWVGACALSGELPVKPFASLVLHFLVHFLVHAWPRGAARGTFLSRMMELRIHVPYSNTCTRNTYCTCVLVHVGSYNQKNTER